MKAELQIAWRYIKSKRKEKVISAIGIFSLVGITLGVATLIIVTSVMNGFRKEFTDRVIGFNGHLALHPFVHSVSYDGISEEIARVPGVKFSHPVVEQQALISNSKTVRGTLTNGLACADLKKKSLIADNIVRGSLDNFAEENAIVIGESLAKKTRVDIGDDVVVIVPQLDETGVGFMPRKKTFKLVATFASGMHEYDNSVSFIPIEMAQKLFKLHHGVTGISVFLRDPMLISDVRDNIHAKYGKQFYITDWQSNNSAFMKAVEIERNVMFLILTLITLVASFNIIACMIMLVKDKEKDIAILRTIGMSRNAITRIFFTVGASIGVCGTFLGAALGLVFSLNIKKIQACIESLIQTKVFAPEVYFLTNLPSLIRVEDVVITIVVALSLSCVATLYPARKASRLNPTEILRYA